MCQELSLAEQLRVERWAGYTACSIPKHSIHNVLDDHPSIAQLPPRQAELKASQKIRKKKKILPPLPVHAYSAVVVNAYI